MGDIKEIVLAVLTPLTKTRWGTKFLVAVFLGGGTGYLTYGGQIPGPYGAGAMVLIAWAYFLYRDKQEKREQPKQDGGL